MIKNWSIIVLVLTVRIAFSQVDSKVYNKLKSHVFFLASDSLKGRSAGSEQERVANQYVINQFKVNRKSKNQYWNFSVTQDSNLQCQMVGAFISNKSPYTILIGSHIDHIGYGGKLSKSPGKKVVHNGADDNAAGVAVLIELQRFFAKRKLPYNLLLIAYTAHEIGTFGSKYISENLDEKYGALVGVLNWDMIGRMDKQNHNLYISCNQKVDSLFEFTQFIHPVYQDQRKVEILDTKHFIDRKILCATFSTGMHSDYHKNSDDAEYINYEGLYQILRYFEILLDNPSFQQFILINRGV
jgi:hypothetical protein